MQQAITRQTLRTISLKKVAVAVGFVLPLAFFLVSGMMGLDYGRHPDQVPLLRTVGTFVETEVLLPRWYFWPSINYLLGVAALVPDIIAYSDAPNTKDFLLASLDTTEYILRFRALYLILSSLTVIWTYILVLEWRKKWAEALFAAALVATSWEVVYHARFTAPDSIMMQFSMFTMLNVMVAYHRPKQPIWLMIAAGGAGLATSAKYSGGILLVPIALAAYLVWKNQDGYLQLVKRLLGIGTIYAIAYLATTPGTVLDTKAFIYGIRYSLRVYRLGWKAGPGDGEILPWAPYTVNPGFEHLRRIATYYSFAVFSHFKLIAFEVILLVPVGVYALWHQNKKALLLFLSYPVVSLILISTQRAFVVRNHQAFIPLLAVLAASGAGYIAQKIDNRYLKGAFIGALSGIVLINAVWLIWAAGTIRDRDTDRFIREFADYLEAHPESNYYVSRRVFEDLNSLPGDAPENITRVPTGTQLAAFYANEASFIGSARRDFVEGGYEYPAGNENWPDLNLSKRWFGPHEINFNYYVSQSMDNDRIMLMTTERVDELDLPICPLNCDS